MLTITSKLQMDQYRKEANLLEFEQHIQSNLLTKLTSRIADIKSETESAAKLNNVDKADALKELEDNPNYIKLCAQSSACETRNASIESELKMLNEAMSSFEKEHQAGIKEDTTFWCFGG